MSVTVCRRSPAKDFLRDADFRGVIRPDEWQPGISANRVDKTIKIEVKHLIHEFIYPVCNALFTETKMKLSDLRAILKGTATEPSDEWNAVIRDATSNTVVIFAISKSSSGERIEQAGTGTLVFLDGIHYILTATHVWDTVLVRSRRIGITIRIGRGSPNEFSIDTSTITVVAFPRPVDCEEWGPDLALLRIHESYVGTIEAFRPFYNLSSPPRNLHETDPLDVVWMLCGAPQVLGEFSETRAHAHCRAFQVGVNSSHHHTEFDYLDVWAHWPSSTAPAKFGGVSGGGLWKLQLYFEPSSGKVDCFRTLEGVAFYQFSRIVEDHGLIRCHGPESLRLLEQRCIEKKD
jgi:hypothetical protein